MGVAYTQKLINEIADAVQIGKMRDAKKQAEVTNEAISKLNVYRKGLPIPATQNSHSVLSMSGSGNFLLWYRCVPVVRLSYAGFFLPSLKFRNN